MIYVHQSETFTISLKVIKNSKALQSYTNETTNKDMVYFNVVGLCGETFMHIRVYQKANYNLMKEGTSFKFSNLVKKDEERTDFFLCCLLCLH